jgi:hypothetical protein
MKTGIERRGERMAFIHRGRLNEKKRETLTHLAVARPPFLVGLRSADSYDKPLDNSKPRVLSAVEGSGGGEGLTFNSFILKLKKDNRKADS